MDSVLSERERIDELGRKGYRIIQDRDTFCFGMDAVLLADFADAGPKDRILDMGTGNGILPLLLRGRDKGSHVTGLEIQEKMAALAARNVALNGLEEEISIRRGDNKEASKLFGKAVFDVIVCNPPYMDEAHGLTNPNEAKAIARHELLCSLEDILREAEQCLVPGGRFYMVHRPRRLPEILEKMRRYHLEPKRLRPVYSELGSDADMFLVQGIRGGKPWLKLEKPLILYRERGVYTEEVRRMYFGEE